MREWLPKRHIYLNEILHREAPPADRLCASCKTTEGSWRCTDCLGQPILCNQCCQSSHFKLPFHRVEHWTGNHFTPAWLWKAGVVIHLGHNGDPCPGHHRNTSLSSTSNEYPLPPPPIYDAPNNIFYTLPDDNNDWLDDDAGDYKPTSSFLNNGKVMVIVHTNGIHHLPAVPCICHDAPSEEIQFLKMGFFPSTYQDIKTVFTFHLLDDYLLDNLECKTSATHYFSKLRRSTSMAFPTSVAVSCFLFFHLLFNLTICSINKDRYRELLRAGRQWRHIKEKKWFGFGHRTAEPGPGEMALFCAACPQPGINLPETWEQDPDQ